MKLYQVTPFETAARISAQLDQGRPPLALVSSRPTGNKHRRGFDDLLHQVVLASASRERLLVYVMTHLKSVKRLRRRSRFKNIMVFEKKSSFLARNDPDAS